MRMGKFMGLFLATTLIAFGAESSTNAPAKQRSIWDIFTGRTNANANTNIGGQVISAKPGATNVAFNNLSSEQISAGLKEALSTGINHAVASLGRTNGFLTNLNVRIPIPANLQKVEMSLRKLGQDALADEFITAMNRAAEQAVPAATDVFVQSLKQLPMADAQTLLLSTNQMAATEYFRRTTTNVLTEKFLPIVQTATTNAGVTRAYKDFLKQAPFLTKVFGSGNLDIDRYITAKSLDGLFLLVADEEKRIRENPQARVTALLEKVFGTLGKTTQQR